MALGFSTNLRNARLDAITTFVGTGAKLALYSGTRPATGGAITSQTKLAEFVFVNNFAEPAVNAVLDANVADDVTAIATGTVTWARLTKSDGTFVMDASAGSDFTLVSYQISTGLTVVMNSFTLSDGNA